MKPAQFIQMRWVEACLAIRMKGKPGDNAMYVERLLSTAREKLVTIADDAPLMEAANLLDKGTDLVIVCNSAGLLAGVITKTDVVGQMSRCQEASCNMAASLTMTRDVVAVDQTNSFRKSGNE